jgi:hypothetical protein
VILHVGMFSLIGAFNSFADHNSIGIVERWSGGVMDC